MNLTAEVISAAQAAQAKYGVPASVTLAQYGQESGWGVHMPVGSNNPFGIKALPGQDYVAASTHEVIKGVTTRVTAKFRKFPSIAAAFEAHAQLLSGKAVYDSAMKAWRAGDLHAGVVLMAAHYATDPHYAQTVMGLIKANNLGRYDAPATVAPTAAPPAKSWVTVLLELFLSLFARK